MFHLADIWAARTGAVVRVVSANDHLHSRGSRHYQGMALDLHSSNPDGLSRMLRTAGYRVLWNVRGHYAHVHVEVDGPPRLFAFFKSPSRPAASAAAAH